MTTLCTEEIGTAAFNLVVVEAIQVMWVVMTDILGRDRKEAEDGEVPCRGFFCLRRADRRVMEYVPPILLIIKSTRGFSSDPLRS